MRRFTCPLGYIVEEPGSHSEQPDPMTNTLEFYEVECGVTAEWIPRTQHGGNQIPQCIRKWSWCQVIWVINQFDLSNYFSRNEMCFVYLLQLSTVHSPRLLCQTMTWACTIGQEMLKTQGWKWIQHKFSSQFFVRLNSFTVGNFYLNTDCMNNWKLYPLGPMPQLWRTGVLVKAGGTRAQERATQPSRATGMGLGATHLTLSFA